jgi:uncharacterized protein (DUF2235 family)
MRFIFLDFLGEHTQHGVIGASGILKKEDYEKFEIAWNYYRTAPSVRHAIKAAGTAALAERNDMPRDEKARRISRKLSMKVPRSAADYIQTAAEDRPHVVTKIRCIGVWDTVGSYGIPAGIGLGALSRIFTAWLLRGFHDTEIGACIEIGLHAVAVDERRRPFAPTVWTIPRGKHPAGDVEQVWFVGAHTNIGGGYLDARLSDIPLIWMMAQVSEIGNSKFGGSLEFDTQRWAGPSVGHAVAKRCRRPAPAETRLVGGGKASRTISVETRSGIPG